MNGSDIRKAIAEDANAEFALKPGPADSGMVRVRGLASAGRGRWRYRESTHYFTGEWTKHDLPDTVRSAELVTVRAAQATIDRRRAVNERRRAACRDSDLLIAQLRRLGIEARHTGASVVVHEPAKLASLLSTISGPADG